MKISLPTFLAVVALVALSGCISVHEKTPDTVTTTTTRETTLTPGATTVQRTTVY